MQLNAAYREMLGDALADAIDAARDRAEDDTIIARCNAGLWLVEVAGDPVADGLTHDEAVTFIEGIDPN